MGINRKKTTNLAKREKPPKNDSSLNANLSQTPKDSNASKSGDDIHSIRANKIAFAVLIVTILAIAIPLVYTYVMHDRTKKPVISASGNIFATKDAEDSINNTDNSHLVRADLSDGMYMPIYYIYEANNELDIFYDNPDTFYITNPNASSIIIADVCFILETYYPIDNFISFSLEDHGGEFEFTYYDLVLSPTLKESHALLRNQKYTDKKIYQKINANDTEGIVICYAFQKPGVYIGRLKFTIQVNGEKLVQTVPINGDQNDLVKLIQIPSDMMTGTRYLQYSSSTNREPSVSNEDIVYIYSNLQDIRNHLDNHYPNPNDYYQIVVSDFASFFNRAMDRKLE